MPLFDDLRSAWGARPPRDKADLVYVPPSKRTEFMNHWNGGPTGLTAASDHARCLAVVKADQDFHMDGRGWNDIGYNGLVCPHGRAIECRGIDYSGAHCPDHNTSAYGWQFAIGKGETATQVMFDRMAQALADCEDRSHHDLRLMGHRDGFNTECPGDQIEAWVKAGMPGAQEDDLMAMDAAERAQLIDDIATAVVTKPVPRPGNYDVALGSQVGAANVNAYRALQILNAQDPAAMTAAVTAAVKAAQPGVDVDALAKAIVLELGKD